MQYPKFEQRVKENIIDKGNRQIIRSTWGMVSAVNQMNNTVDIWLAAPDSGEFSEVLFNVPYPVSPGIQVAAPPIGYACWVDFKGNDYSNPIVTHFFNPSFFDTQYEKQTTAINNVPRFMLGM